MFGIDTIIVRKWYILLCPLPATVADTMSLMRGFEFAKCEFPGSHKKNIPRLFT